MACFVAFAAHMHCFAPLEITHCVVVKLAGFLRPPTSALSDGGIGVSAKMESYTFGVCRLPVLVLITQSVMAPLYLISASVA